MTVRNLIAATLAAAAITAVAGPAVAAPAAPDLQAVSSGCAYTSATPTLAPGSTGDAVRQAQCLMGINADGIFGEETEQTVLAIQSSFGLATDGIIGPQTWDVLYNF
ncbi:peptidoglycan-binding domain-containing protein [Nocardia sp. NPDC019395]|uniref:peptidoglycan-binding domain-containing protein n=1 Tax=Nocardia sp. NPDC019395 TaxID=3154686 RepID=UPI0033F12E45